MGSNIKNATAETSILHREFIYDQALFPSCHASTLAETRNGLVAAWFGGTGEGHSDVGIWLARHENGYWTTPVEVTNGVQSPTLRYPCWNPVLFQPNIGPLQLFYKVGVNFEHWWGMLMRSEDGGQTWSEPKRLPDGIVGPSKNKPIQLSSGDLLCPSSREIPNNGGWYVHFERTSDLGHTWEKTGPVNDGKTIAAIQPSVLTHADGHLQAIGRTKQGFVFTIESEDQGRTWGDLTLLDLPNPNSGTDALTLQDSRFLLVYNHAHSGRTPLNAALSHDGRHWTPVLTLEDADGEFSYPAVIQTRDGLVHISYTWNRTRIGHIVLDPDKLGE